MVGATFPTSIPRLQNAAKRCSQKMATRTTYRTRIEIQHNQTIQKLQSSTMTFFGIEFSQQGSIGLTDR